MSHFGLNPNTAIIVDPMKRITKSKWVINVNKNHIQEVLSWCKEQFGESCRNPKNGRWRVGWTEIQPNPGWGGQAPNFRTRYDTEKVRIFFYNEQDAVMFTLRFS